ncbi:MAG: DUF3298 domain-containing protein [Candidatus Omnitrophica bacterium]|nr:DUF3298 domain-containing protein [Candidatus Omnitrophota bacterium]
MKRILIFIIFLFVSSVSAAQELSSVEKIKFQEKKGSCEVTGEYPQFKILKISANKLKNVNKEINVFARSLFIKFLTKDAIGQQIKEDFKTSSNGNTFDIDFNVIRADTRYVSVIFQTYFMQENAPHGVGHFYAFNYDVEHSKIIHLSDLFKPGTDYLKQLRGFCNRDLEKQLGNGFYDKDAVNDSTQFTFDQESLIIHFSAYEVACYAAGMPEVKISFKKLIGLKE